MIGVASADGLSDPLGLEPRAAAVVDSADQLMASTGWREPPVGMYIKDAFEAVFVQEAAGRPVLYNKALPQVALALPPPPASQRRQPASAASAAPYCVVLFFLMLSLFLPASHRQLHTHELCVVCCRWPQLRSPQHSVWSLIKRVAPEMQQPHSLSLKTTFSCRTMCGTPSTR